MAAATATRLERLVSLLDSGTLPRIRMTAIDQLGEIVRNRPDDIGKVLTKIVPRCLSKHWDTRISAGMAIESVLKNYGQGGFFIRKNVAPIQEPLVDIDVALTLETNEELVSSAGAEYEVDAVHGSPKELLKYQRSNISRSLGGLSIVPETENTHEFIQDEDLIVQGTSARERTMARRKRKKVDGVAKILASPAVEEVSDMVFTDDEPLTAHTFVEYLQKNMLDSFWIKRHGSTLGIFYLLSGIESPGSELVGAFEAVLVQNCFHILIMDRFTDYLGDAAVSPVRENAAQLLGLLFRLCGPGTSQFIFRNLLVLVRYSGQDAPWQIQHGGLLGIRQLLADGGTRKIAGFLKELYLALKKTLVDSDDDIRLVSIEIVLLVFQDMLDCRWFQLENILEIVWHGLDETNDLNPTTCGLMELLSKIYRSELSDRDALEKFEKRHVSALVEKLLMFMRHSNPAIRMSTCNTLIVLLDRIEPDGELVQSVRMDNLFRMVFQNLLIEDDFEILANSFRLFSRMVSRHVPEELLFIELLSLTMVPHFHPYDADRFFWPLGQTVNNTVDLGFKASDMTLLRGLNAVEEDNVLDMSELSISEADSKTEPKQAPLTLEREPRIQNKYLACVSLARLGLACFGSEKNWYRDHLRECLVQNSFAARQQYVCWMLDTAITETTRLSAMFEDFYHDMVEILNETSHQTYFRETDNLLLLLQRYASAETWKPYFNETSIEINFTSLDALVGSTGTEFDLYRYPQSIVAGGIDTIRQELEQTIGEIRNSAGAGHQELCSRIDMFSELWASYASLYEQYWIRTRALMAMCFVNLHWKGRQNPSHLFPLQEKLTPIIRPLMSFVKTEDTACQILGCNLVELEGFLIDSHHFIRDMVSQSLVRLVTFLHDRPGIQSKIVSNVVALVRHHECDPDRADLNHLECFALNLEGKEQLDWIWSIGWPSVIEEKYGQWREVIIRERVLAWKQLIENKDLNRAFSVFKFLVAIPGGLDHFGVFWDMVMGKDSESRVQAIFICKLIWMLCCASMSYPTTGLNNLLFGYMECINRHICSSSPLLRFWASRSALGIIHLALGDSEHFEIVYKFLTDKLLALEQGENGSEIQGLLEVLYAWFSPADDLGKSLPYVNLVIVGVMKNMNHFNPTIRTIASLVFSNLMILLPIENSVESPSHWPAKLVEKRVEQRRFIDSLLRPSSIGPFQIPIRLDEDLKLRKYQVEGINWLGFLNRYGLNGILCDDMGLGKTLQTLVIIASDHHVKRSRNNSRPISCIICPTSLISHWNDEIQKFVPNYLVPAMYHGDRSERIGLLYSGTYDVVITSYDILRNDVASFAELEFNYIVLDEGHMIKNPKSKTTLTVKKMRGIHRLVLSGTPIQNSVVELWSLFDFLMPGYLGSYQSFMKTYGKPVLGIKNDKSVLGNRKCLAALEKLHKVTLPFILRRMKDQVLEDLPSKIIQDIYCHLSGVQRQLYEEFAKYAVDGITDPSHQDQKSDAEPEKEKIHVFHALQLLKKICNHPFLFLYPEYPKQTLINFPFVPHLMSEFGKELASTDQANLSAKLLSLRDLLVDIGIARDSDDSLTLAPHRALVFCTTKSSLDLIENLLLVPHLPNVSYMRLDGSVPVLSRTTLVSRFNNDPSIDLLLLTTSVGGQGLTLTGADTVIFFESDWNPSKDLQAMDRAHRLGQTRAVSVYRLLSKNTIEEKCMSLQKFKLRMTDAIITQQNTALGSMDTKEVVDLLSLK